MIKSLFFFQIQERKNCCDDALTPLLYSVAPDKKFLLTLKRSILWYTLSVSCVEGLSHYGDHSVPTWCNLITVDLGMPRQCPRRAVQNASREHPVLGDRNIRRDRWLINHGGACTVSMGGLPLESTLWAGGQREHQLSNMSPGHITTLTGELPGVAEAESGGKTWRTAFTVSHCSLSVSLCLNILWCDFIVRKCLVFIWTVYTSLLYNGPKVFTVSLTMCAIWQSSHLTNWTQLLWWRILCLSESNRKKSQNKTDWTWCFLLTAGQAILFFLFFFARPLTQRVYLCFCLLKKW